MKGFKAFNSDLTCRGFQYEIGKTYEMNDDPVICDRGFHFCESIANCYRYYPMKESTRICEVEAIGKIDTENNEKFCTNKIRIVREITNETERKGNLSKQEGYCNTGNCNTGNYNTGDYNTGDRNTGSWNTGNCNTGNWNTGNCNTGNCNTGDWNTGDRNTGNRNTGDWNTGNRNTGNYNTGDRNTGDRNTGDRNTGSWNTGNRNTGDCNTGDYNTGDYNTGNWNTGNWNISDGNNGCFMTIEPEIWIFNKPSGMTLHEWKSTEAYNILWRMPSSAYWKSKERMSDDEKMYNPEYKKVGGILKDDGECNRQRWWNDLRNDEKKCVMSIPNFDADIFRKCTGIDVNV